MATTSPEGKHIIEATVNLPAAPLSSDNHQERVLESAAAMFKAVAALAWPILVLFLFFQLKEPLVQSIALLPELLKKSTEIGVGSFSMKLQQAAAATGDPELGDLVQGLSGQAVDVLLETGRSTHAVAGGSPSDPQFVSLPSTTSVEALKELEAKKLLTFREPWDRYSAFLKSLPLAPIEGGDRQAFTTTRELTAAERRRLTSQGYSLTPKGLRAFELVVGLVSSLVKASS